MRALAFLAVIAIAGPAQADGHRAFHIADRFVAAWNAGDVAAMTELWTTEGLANGEATRVRRPGRLVVASTLIEQRMSDGTTRVDFDAVIGGVRSHVTLVQVWGPDLPGGHHPDGRFFIRSLLITRSTRAPWLALLWRFAS